MCTPALVCGDDRYGCDIYWSSLVLYKSSVCEETTHSSLLSDHLLLVIVAVILCSFLLFIFAFSARLLSSIISLFMWRVLLFQHDFAGAIVPE